MSLPDVQTLCNPTTGNVRIAVTIRHKQDKDDASSSNGYTSTRDGSDIETDEEVDESKVETKMEETKSQDSSTLPSLQPLSRIVVNGIAVVDTAVSDQCWRCHQSICLVCGATKHDGDNCNAAHDIVLGEMLKSKKDWVRCPKSQHIIERTTGCDHMTCKCGAEFCFYCRSMPHCGTKCKKKKVG